MRLGKRYKQLIDQWVSEILQKYPQVRFEGVETAPEGGVSIKLRGPEDVLMLVMHEYADRQVEAARKYRCDILFAPISEPPIDPNWPDWDIWNLKDEEEVEVSGRE
jgi:hypothetical protein